MSTPSRCGYCGVALSEQRARRYAELGLPPACTAHDDLPTLDPAIRPERVLGSRVAGDWSTGSGRPTTPAPPHSSGVA